VEDGGSVHTVFTGLANTTQHPHMCLKLHQPGGVPVGGKGRRGGGGGGGGQNRAPGGV
jgi:hypothetical protein